MRAKVLLALAVASFLAGYAIAYVTTPRAKVAERGALPQGHFVVVLSLKVRDASGRLIGEYTKVGDPPVKNFIVWLMRCFFREYDETLDQQLNSTDLVNTAGTSFTVDDDGLFSPYKLPRIVIGNASSPSYSLDKYYVEQKAGEVKISTIGCFYNSTHMWVMLRGTWTNPYSDMNVTEVGLWVWQYLYVGGSTTSKYILIFYDALSSPVTVPSSGSLTVTYYLYIRYA